MLEQDGRCLYAAAAGATVQGRVAEVVGGRYVSAFPDQKVHRHQPVFAGDDVQGGLPVFAPCTDVGAAAHQQLHGVILFRARRGQERRVAGAIGLGRNDAAAGTVDIDVSAFFDEQAHRRHLAEAGCLIERRFSLLVTGVDVGPFFQQQAHAIHRPGIGGQVKRRLAPLVSCVHRRTRRQQQALRLGAGDMAA